MVFRLNRRYFVRPPLVALEGFSYLPDRGIKTYSEYNYLRPGIGTYLRTRHFEHALHLTRRYFHTCDVIDLGCADGPFLPSLASHFNHVIGIDPNPMQIEIASLVIRRARLENATVFCNNGLSVEETRARIADRSPRILFLLETLEHVGETGAPWESRVGFLTEISRLIAPEGIMVVSVPNMVGLPFLSQRLGFALLGASRERISLRNLLLASFLNDTSDLEKHWERGHLGFNHRKLERRIRDKFDIVKKENIFWQVIYVLKRKQGA
jgi:2-polyprenyl-3-methyl-5-hydroxy-6-metoxy-1,4-benzoquinol methylase